MRFGTVALVALLLLPGATCWAADVPAVSKIDNVTVFPSGAEVARTAKVNLDKGEHTIVFQDVAAEAVPSSIRVEGKATGNLDIGSVDSRRLFVPQSDAANAEIERRRIEDDIQRLKDENAVYQAQVQAAETQKTLIANLAQLPARPAPPSGAAEAPENWGAILSTIASGTQNAQRSLVDAQSRIRELDRQIKELQKKLSALPPARIRRTEIKVFVSAETAVEADITVLYQVPNASWVALYDARLTSGNKTSPAALKLTRRASISQRTGESWDDVALTLSTTRPTAGASAPELKTVTVDFEPDFLPRPMAAPAPEATARSLAPARRKMAQGAEEADALDDEKKVKLAVRPKQAKVVAAPFQALFDVPGRLSIPNTGEAKRVELVTESIEPSLIVRTVPKETAKAYLYAKLALPKDSTPVLPGAVSLFRDGTFVGTNRVPILTPGEDHELGFGVDDLVRVKHTVAETKRGETGLISTSKTDVRNYRISVKNMHERAITAVIFDQVPVSENEDIRVEVLSRTQPTKRDVDGERGVFAWEKKIDPDEEMVLDFGYRVTWPSGKKIIYR